jgi:hypothetical protein
MTTDARLRVVESKATPVTRTNLRRHRVCKADAGSAGARLKPLLAPKPSLPAASATAGTRGHIQAAR